MIKSCIIATAISFFITGCVNAIDEEKEAELTNDTEYSCEKRSKSLSQNSITLPTVLR